MLVAGGLFFTSCGKDDPKEEQKTPVVTPPDEDDDDNNDDEQQYPATLIGTQWESQQDDEVEIEGSIIPVVYVETFAFSDETKFTITMGYLGYPEIDQVQSGTYTYKDGTVVFKSSGREDTMGTINKNELTVFYSVGALTYQKK